MVVADPAAELVALVRAQGDPAPSQDTPGAQARARLIRRRFGLSLPPSFDESIDRDAPIRPAVAADGPAIALVKYRVFGTNYRKVLSDDFLDGRDVVPSPSFWVGRAMVPPSRRHHLLVWGRPGRVQGYVDTGPVREDESPGEAADPDEFRVGEVYELYVDPAAQGLGGGGRLLAAAVESLDAAGFTRLELSVIATNSRARAVYAASGWRETGRVDHVDLGVVAFDEVRLTRAAPSAALAGSVDD